MIRNDGALMRHELAYILGQIGNPYACPHLITILEDENDDILVRHECAEALGAIGSAESVPILMKYMNHKAIEIAETCQIAIDLIKWKCEQHLNSASESSLYLSEDPAPPVSDNFSIEQLRDQLLDSQLSLFNRYRAMFSLRNYNNDSAALALVSGFSDSSALFRHEIAFVLGQMQRPVTIEGLALVLQKEDEHRMVRYT